MKAINLFLLAGIIGAELILGIIVAPAIFYPQNLIGEGVLSIFQSGLIMSEIFAKFAYILFAICVINFLYELYAYFVCDLSFRLRFSKLILSLIILILAGFFLFYFTAYILDAQNLGESATKSKEFIQIHSASEAVMKIIVLMQIFLYFLSFKIAKKM